MLWYFIDPLHTESISPRIKPHKSFIFFIHCIPAIYTLDFKINTDIQISVVCYMETFELSVEMIIGLRSFFCCLFGTSSRTNPRISSKSCLKYTIGITNYTCDTQFQINHQFYTCTVLFLFGFFFNSYVKLDSPIVA